MANTTPNISIRGKITDSTSGSLRINNSIIFDLDIYKRVMVNFLISKRRELYHYKNYPLNYIRSGISRDRRVYEKMRSRVRVTPDMLWINNYHQENNTEINLKLEPSSSILQDYHFICETQRLRCSNGRHASRRTYIFQ